MFSPTRKSIFRSKRPQLIFGVVILYLSVTQLLLPSDRWRILSVLRRIASTNNAGCSNLAGGDRIVVTVKTGATEAVEKVPIQFKTALRCVPAQNILWFSDMNQKIDNHHLHDALDTIEPSITYGNPDFEIYREQQKLQDPLLITTQLRTMRHPKMPEKHAAWVLDKYKNIHIAEKSWTMKPDMDWYLHIDADTYVVWSSLLFWLPTLDPAEKFFIGSKVYQDNHAFAHGGSGILLSKAAAYDLVVEHNGTAALWDHRMNRGPYGDALLAQAAEEHGLNVTNAFPMFHGETPFTVWFHAAVWCMPIVTFHHISGSEWEQLKAFEEQRVDPNVSQ